MEDDDDDDEEDTSCDLLEGSRSRPITKTVKVNFTITNSFMKDYSINLLMISRLKYFPLAVLQSLMFNVYGNFGISKIEFFIFFRTERLKQHFNEKCDSRWLQSGLSFPKLWWFFQISIKERRHLNSSPTGEESCQMCPCFSIVHTLQLLVLVNIIHKQSRNFNKN